MVVCRYYQQGNCRYGDKCRFEHPPGNTGYSYQHNYNNNAYKWQAGGSSGGVTFRSNFSVSNRFEVLTQQDGKQARGKAAGGLLNLSPDDILNMIAADMENWEPSHTWWFSCYTYFKDGSCLPGLDDISPEELRLEAYEVEKSGNGQLYVLKMKDLVNKYRQIRSQLIRPGMQTKQKLIQIIEEDRKRLERGGGVASTTTSSSLFTGSAFSSSTGFGQSSSQQSTGLFGKPVSHSNNLFGNSQSTGSIFGNTQSAGTVFGNNQSGSVFGTSQSAGSVFGNNQSGSLFGNSQSAGSVFGNSQSGGTLFGGIQSSSAFVNHQSGSSILTNNQPQGTNVFGNNSQTGVQQASSSSGGLFGKPAFGGTGNKPGFGDAQGGLFGNNAGASGMPATGPSAFGQLGFGAAGGTLQGAAPTKPSAATSSAAPATKSSMYTPINELTAEERQQFEAAQFTAGRLPTRPPPKELC